MATPAPRTIRTDPCRAGALRINRFVRMLVVAGVVCGLLSFATPALVPLPLALMLLLLIPAIPALLHRGRNWRLICRGR